MKPLVSAGGEAVVNDGLAQEEEEEKARGGQGGEEEDTAGVACSEEEEGEVDEWEDDADPGYVTYPMSEAEFYALEKEAMEAAHRAELAAQFGKDFKLDDEEGGEADGEDVGMKEAEALLKKAPIPSGPDSPQLVVPREVQVDGGGSLLAGAEAAVWPRHADDFAFSQDGDEDESYLQAVDAINSEKDMSVGALDLSGVALMRSQWGAEASHKYHSANKSSSSRDQLEASARILEMSLGAQFGVPCRASSSAEDRSAARNSDDTSDVSDPDVASSEEGADDEHGLHGHEVLECFHLKVSTLWAACGLVKRHSRTGGHIGA